MTNNKIKKGLSYISERTNQLRYSDKDTNEQWLSPLSQYIPLEEIKRGQPVSVASSEEIAKLAKDHGVSLESIDVTNKTFIVLTNPSIHEHSIGLSMEYSPSPFKGNRYEEAKSIHIISTGSFIANPGYLIKTNQGATSEILQMEYIPEFMSKKENLGRKIFVKGSTKGELTVVPEEAYLANNNIIQIGFLSDTISSALTQDSVGTIELQIEGDARGPIDHTQLEATLGENLVITKDHPLLVFAVGQEEKENFKFSLNILSNSLPKNGFIALRRIDGKTVFITPIGAADPMDLGSNAYEAEDYSFMVVSDAYNESSETNKTITLDNLSKTSLKAALTSAINYISSESLDITNSDGEKTHYEKITKFIFKEEGASLTCTAEHPGGQYEIYISKEMKLCLSLVGLFSFGSYDNRGLAILADIRNPKRQNILGIYLPKSLEETELLKIGDQGIFLHLGIIKTPKKTLQTGATYYLGRLGRLTTVPQSYYDSIVKVGFAQAANQLIVSCEDPRQFQKGELPIGFIKPSVNGGAEADFLLMDGETQYKVSVYAELYDFLHNTLEVEKSPTDKGDVFIIPKIFYSKRKNEIDQVPVVAQIKAKKANVFEGKPPCPFLKRFYKNGLFKKPAPTIDITPIVAGFGVLNEFTTIPEDTNIDIRVFVDTRKNALDMPDRVWTEVHPGFQLFNNTEYYGFEWRVKYTKNQPGQIVDETHLFGTWELEFTYNAKFEKEGTDGQGAKLALNPFEPPLSIADMPTEVIILKKDLWEKQFDIEGVFERIVENNVELSSGEGNPAAVSGIGIKNYIETSINTNKLEVRDILKVESPSGNFLSVDDTDNIGFLLKGNICIANTSKLSKNTKYTVFTDSENGALSYGILNENKLQKLEKDDFAKLSIYENSISDAALSSKNYVNTKVEDLRSQIAGKNNFVNAKTVRGLDLGFPGAAMADGTPGYIPYLEKITSINSDYYKTRIGRSIEVHDKISKETAAVKSIIELFNSNKNFDIKIGDISPNASRRFDTISISTYDGGGNLDIDFKNNTVTGKGVSGTPLVFGGTSSIKQKQMNTEFIPSNIAESSNLYPTFEEFSQTHDIVSEDHKDSETLNLKENAASAISVMPTAAFKYLSADDNLKRWFGILTERLADTAKGITSENYKKEIDTTLSYTFTEEEISSIKSYLKMMTNDGETSQNVISSIGILLQASKEIQDRLLAVEASTFGEDAASLPGNPASLVDKSPKNITNEHTILGLNRLVKALCGEMFLNVNPEDLTKIISEGHIVDYSRLDKVCKEIYGTHEPTEENPEINIDADYKALPKNDIPVLSREDSYTKITSEEFGNKYFTKESSEARVTNETLGKTGEELKGINDTINRLALKLSTLTKEINDEDNIGNGPKALDRIRDNIEALIYEVHGAHTYSDDPFGKGNPKQPYEKTKNSRIDNLGGNFYSGDSMNVDDTYNLNLIQGEDDPDTIKTSKRSFNTKPIRGEFKPTESGVSDTQQGTLTLKDPTEAKDLQYATVIDILVDAVGKDLDRILRKSIDQEGSEPNNGKEKESAYRSYKTILTRLETIESALDKICKKFKNTNINFEKFKDDLANPGVLDLDSLQKDFSELIGVKQDSNGKWIVDDDKGYDLKSISNLTARKEIDLPLNILRVLKLLSNNVLTDAGSALALYKSLGADYIIKDSPVTAHDTNNVTHDMIAILKTLYGKDEVEGNTTEYTHKINTDESNVDSPVISGLWEQVSLLPTRYDAIGNTINDGNSDFTEGTKFIYTDTDNTNTANKVFDPKGIPIDKGQLISNGHRKYLNPTEEENKRAATRFSAIEENLKALRRMLVGNLEPNDNNKLSVKLGWLYGASKEELYKKSNSIEITDFEDHIKSYIDIFLVGQTINSSSPNNSITFENANDFSAQLGRTSQNKVDGTYTFNSTKSEIIFTINGHPYRYTITIKNTSLKLATSAKKVDYDFSGDYSIGDLIDTSSYNTIQEIGGKNIPLTAQDNILSHTADIENTSKASLAKVTVLEETVKKLEAIISNQNSTIKNLMDRVTILEGNFPEGTHSGRALRMSDVADDDTNEKPTSFSLATTSQVSSAVSAGTVGLIASTEADRKYIPKAWAPKASSTNQLLTSTDKYSDSTNKGLITKEDADKLYAPAPKESESYVTEPKNDPSNEVLRKSNIITAKDVTNQKRSENTIPSVAAAYRILESTNEGPVKPKAETAIEDTKKTK